MKVAQSCLTLCDPMDYMVHGMLQARILEWVTFPFSRGSSHPRDQTQGSNPGLPHGRQNLGDPGSIPALRRSAGEGIGYPLQYS